MKENKNILCRAIDIVIIFLVQIIFVAFVLAPLINKIMLRTLDDYFSKKELDVTQYENN